MPDEPRPEAFALEPHPDRTGAAELRAQNRTLRAWSKSNQALMHSQSTPEAQYLSEICRIITEDCGHAMVWIGFAEADPARTVRPVAHAGFDAGYLETLRITWADTERGQGPTGIAIRTGQPTLCQDMRTDTRFAPWREEALRRGYQSSLVLPFRDGSRPLGAITLYAYQPDAFPAGEVTLLLELAADLGHGIVLNRLREEKAQAYAQLKEADRRKDEFLAILAHELRNPLAPIRNAAHLLALHPAADPELRGLYDLIGRQAGHMARMVDDLLEVSRLEQGKLHLRRERLDLGTVVAQALAACREPIQERHQRLELDLPGEVLEVDADPVRMEQIVSNLVHNASRHTPPDGTIRVAAAREGGDAVLRVRDSGAGMTAEVLAHAFDLFYQGAADLGRASGGLGVGLSLVQGLARLHGGRIAAASAGPGQGSEFTLVLPAPAPATGPAEPEPAAPSRIQVGPHRVQVGPPRVQVGPHRVQVGPPRVQAGPHREVLVVDDNPEVVGTVKLLLEAMGCQVATATTGLAGVKLALGLRPRLALVDLGLPDLSGLEVAARIRTGLGRAIQLIALTGYSRDADMAAATAAGFDRYLVKSTDPGELVRIVAECLL